MKNKKTVIAVIVLLVLIIGAVLAWSFLRPAEVTGEKEISVTVIHADGSRRVFDIKTESTALAEPLVKEGIISGEEGPYGLYILSADGETADEKLQQWWCVSKSGVQASTGVSEIMIENGDSYEIELKTGW